MRTWVGVGWVGVGSVWRALGGVLLELVGLTVVLVASCVLDPDHPCGAHEVVYGDDVRCVCEDGYVTGEHGCVACGTNEVAQSNACVCKTGYARSGGDAGPCSLPPADAASVCATDSDCAGTGATYCDPLTRACLVEGCSLGSEDCYLGTQCCDRSTSGVVRHVCVAEGTCSQ